MVTAGMHATTKETWCMDDNKHATCILPVRENVTLVRRDANEEKTIISYFVPKTPNYDITSIREWVKAKLPAYAVPSGMCHTCAPCDVTDSAGYGFRCGAVADVGHHEPEIPLVVNGS